MHLHSCTLQDVRLWAKFVRNDLPMHHTSSNFARVTTVKGYSSEISNHRIFYMHPEITHGTPLGSVSCCFTTISDRKVTPQCTHAHSFACWTRTKTRGTDMWFSIHWKSTERSSPILPHSSSVGSIAVCAHLYTFYCWLLGSVDQLSLKHEIWLQRGGGNTVIMQFWVFYYISW